MPQACARLGLYGTVDEKKSYQGELTILTDVAEMPDDERSIGWIDVPGEARRVRAGSWTNVAEAEHAIRHLTNHLRNGKGSAGVVTPFAAQAQLIRRLARRSAPKQPWSPDTQSRAGTTASGSRLRQGHL